MLARCARFALHVFFAFATGILLFNAWQVAEAIHTGALG